MGKNTTRKNSAKRRKFGCVRELPSGNFRADYLGPDRRRHPAPFTFQLEKHAKNWLDREKKLIERGKWTSPAERAAKAAAKDARRAARRARSSVTLETYGRAWVKQRPLADTTRVLYSRNLEKHVYPILGNRPLGKIKRSDIEAWHEWALAAKIARRPREQAYTALRSMLGHAKRTRLIKRNPCQLEGVIQDKPDRTGVTLTSAQIAAVAAALDSPADTAAIREDVRTAMDAKRRELATAKRREPEEITRELNKVRRDATRSARAKHGIGRPEWVALTMLACFGALRTGELQDLRRRDISLADGTVDISRAARYIRPSDHLGANDDSGTDDADAIQFGWAPNSDVKAEGNRPVPVAPHLEAMLQRHLDRFVDPEPDALLFPPIGWTRLTEREKAEASPKQRNQRLSSSTVFEYWKAALDRAGVPDVHFHDLRHTGASLYAQAGATLKETMELLGHKRPDTALSYQHGTAERRRELAAEVSRRNFVSLSEAA